MPTVSEVSATLRRVGMVALELADVLETVGVGGKAATLHAESAQLLALATQTEASGAVDTNPLADRCNSAREELEKTADLLKQFDLADSVFLAKVSANELAKLHAKTLVDTQPIEVAKRPSK